MGPDSGDPAAEPAAASGDLLRVQVVLCPQPGSCRSADLQLPSGAFLSDALRASLLLAPGEWSDPDLKAGIWGRVRPLNTPLRDQDRVEVYRPLLVDPKEARRQRYRRHRERQQGG